jgi:hypothetical protein
MKIFNTASVGLLTLTLSIGVLWASVGAEIQVEKNPVHGNQFRILTLGDSITAIFRDQIFLRVALNKENVDAIFVGAEGKDQNKHEGHSGWSIGAIEEKVVDYISSFNANVVLLQISVNNMHHGLGVKGKDYPPYQEGVQGQGARPSKTLNELGASWGASTYGSGYLTERVNGLLDQIWKGMATNFAAGLQKLIKS